MCSYLCVHVLVMCVSLSAKKKNKKTSTKTTKRKKILTLSLVLSRHLTPDLCLAVANELLN